MGSVCLKMIHSAVSCVPFLSRAELCAVELYSIEQYGAVLCCAVLCCAVLCCAVLCCAVLCCAVLCCAVPSRAMPCHAVLCPAELCCAVLLLCAPCQGSYGRCQPRPLSASVQCVLLKNPLSVQTIKVVSCTSSQASLHLGYGLWS